MPKDKRMSPLRSKIEAKDCLRRDLHVGDVVIAMPNGVRTNASGVCMIVGETKCYTRVVELGPDVVVGAKPLDTRNIDDWRSYDAKFQLHAGELYLLKEHEGSPWVRQLRDYIQERT